MENPRSLLIIFFLIINSPSFSQKLKKADRRIAENIQIHVNYLSGDKVNGRVAGSEGEKSALEYIIGQFKKTGYAPAGDGSSWLQKFNIPAGREIAPATRFFINGKELILYTDFFPFPFSASNKAEASVAMELAENGVPWFVDLKELLDNEEGTQAKDTSVLIRTRAERAAAKGATALIVYNTSQIPDLVFNSKDSVETSKIPVLYLTGPAMKKHLSKASALLDIKLNIVMNDKVIKGYNVAAYSDNAADSTVMTTADLDDEKGVAALLELSRLLKNNQYRSLNFLFVVYPGGGKGAYGNKYFIDHPVLNLQKVSYAINLDTTAHKGLPAVKQSIVSINALRRHETKTRP